MMHWYSNIDWAAVIAAVVAILNAIQHAIGQKKQAAAHRETMDTLTGEVPKS